MEWFEIWKIEYLKFLKLCLNDYILINYLFFKQSLPLILLDNYSRDDEIFFHWTSLVLEHPFLNITCFLRSFAISGYYSTPRCLKTGRISSSKIKYWKDFLRQNALLSAHELINPKPRPSFSFSNWTAWEKIAPIFKNREISRVRSLKVMFPFPFVYDTSFAYLSLLI